LIKTEKEKDKAVVVIPLKTEKYPALAHIWLIETDKARKEIDRQEKVAGWVELPLYQEIEDKVYKTFTVISHQNGTEITGKSFNLALALLKKAIAEKKQEARKTLALDWIITGDVDDKEKVISVEIGNKAAVSTKRNWLFPSENKIKLTQEFILFTYYR